MKLLIVFLLLTQVSFGQIGLGDIRGVVVLDKGEPVPFSRVRVYSSNDSLRTLKAVSESDFDGRFQINSLTEGKYDLVIEDQYYGGDSVRVFGVQVNLNRITFVDTIKMTINEENLPRIPEIPNTIRIRPFDDPFGRSKTIKSEDIIRP